MTKDQITAWAREVWSAGEVYIGPPEKSLERFAALAYAAGAEAEREECAKVCDSFAESEKPSELWTTYMGVAYKNSAAAIRARGNT